MLTPAAALEIGLVDRLLPDPAACLEAAIESAKSAAEKDHSERD